MKRLRWHTEQRRVDDLMPWEGNPRQMTERQMQDLKNSLERLNLMSIPVVDADNRIVSGHQRMKILQLLGRGEEVVDVRMPNRKLTDQEFIEANLRENKNLGEWDFDMLANFDEEILKDIGWQQFEINQIFQLNMDDPKNEWSNMPEFEQDDLGIRTIKIHFEKNEYVNEFASLINQKITEKTKYLWYPKKENEKWETEQ